MELKIYERLLQAYETTTQNINRFKNTIEAIKWDNIFTADGETYFLLNGLILTIENINPFAEAWKPSITFSDNSMISFK